MSKIEDALKCRETEDVVITDEDRVDLVDMLAMIAHVLKNGKLWFNKEGVEHQGRYIYLCEKFAAQLANLKVNQEN